MTSASTASPVPAVRGGRHRGHRVAWTITAVLTSAACVAIGSISWVQVSGRAHIVAQAAATPAPVALVLGAGLSPGGRPSPYLAARLNTAQQLYEKHTVKAILLSGDGSSPTHDEPAAMYDYLIDHGVPAADIAIDDAGLDTHDSCVRAHDVYGLRRAIVVTQDFHLPRALFLCEHAGIDAIGVGAARDGGSIIWYTTREMLASLKAAFDAVTDRPPAQTSPADGSVNVIIGRGD